MSPLWWRCPQTQLTTSDAISSSSASSVSGQARISSSAVSSCTSLEESGWKQYTKDMNISHQSFIKFPKNTLSFDITYLISKAALVYQNHKKITSPREWALLRGLPLVWTLNIVTQLSSRYLSWRTIAPKSLTCLGFPSRHLRTRCCDRNLRVIPVPFGWLTLWWSRHLRVCGACDRKKKKVSKNLKRRVKKNYALHWQKL